MATEDIKQLARTLHIPSYKLSEHSHLRDGVLNTLNKVEKCLIHVDQSPHDLLQLGMSLVVDALKQLKWLRHPDEEIKLLVATYLSKFMRITTPIVIYKDDTMREVLELIVDSFHGLHYVTALTFGKRDKILDIMAWTRSFVLMLDLQCDELILQIFNYSIVEIKNRHSDKVKTNMFDILSMILDEDDDICKQLQLHLLAIWREELVVSPCAYKLAKWLIEQKIESFRGQMTEKELISLFL
ncbi:hypothetical protein SUGI_0517170 [Cryptomeria japonica]|nr:hypothetical protein SUGI_0517170 [Cryptomeria japonica]